MNITSKPASTPKTGGSKRTKKKWLIAALVVALVAGLLLIPKNGGPGAPAKGNSSQYIYGKAERQDITTALTDSGTLEPADSYTVISLVSGEILSAAFETGDMVAKDDVLYRMDSSNTANSIERAENALSQRKRSYDKLLESREDLTVTAPIGGTVSGITAKVGGKVSAGMVAAEIENTSALLLTEYFSDAHANLIRDGMPVTVSIPHQMMTRPDG